MEIQLPRRLPLVQDCGTLQIGGRNSRDKSILYVGVRVLQGTIIGNVQFAFINKISHLFKERY